ncbi:MAG: hypothetical protein GYB65_19380 [Chloroflexi bacterium]|nr:hypothetical protein [Chloroflexota bacterium]
MKVRLVFAVLLIAVLLPVQWGAPAHAQPPETPLIILSGYDVFLASPQDGTLTPLVMDRHVLGIALSPDGARLAYTAWAPISIEAVERTGGIGGGPLPADIHVLDLGTGTDTLIAAQPEDARFMVDGGPDSALLRSKPTWSPDGTQLAWTEIHYPSSAQETNRLMVYDFDTGNARVVATHLPERAYVGGPQDVVWGAGGLAVLAVTYRETGTGTEFMRGVEVYDPVSGVILAEAYYSDEAEQPQRPVDFAWMTLDGQAYVGMLFGDGQWRLLDPATGQVIHTPNSAELYSPLVPGGVVLALTFDPDDDNFYRNRIWTPLPDGLPLPYNEPMVVIAPDGQAMAFPQDGSVVLYRDGVVIATVPMAGYISSVVWGPTAWRIAGEGSVAETPDTTTACPGTLPSRLVAGGMAQVIPDTSANNMRATPGTAGDMVVQILPGEPFPVVDGPVCADGYAWWQVQYGGTTGWTAEGDSSSYWLEPVN